MDEAKAHEIRQWLFKAGQDLRSAKRLFTDEPPILDTRLLITASRRLKRL